MGTTPRPTPVWQLTIIALIAGVLGGVVGVLLANPNTQHRGQALGIQVDDAHGQDIVLCTTYALVIKTVRTDDATSVLAAIPPLRLGLVENPDANPQIRDAALGAIEALDAILARNAAPEGLSHPPEYDPATVKASWERMSQACNLDQTH